MTKKLKKTTAFLSAVAMVMAMLLYFPSGMFSNIDWGLKASAEGETQTENWIDSAEAFAGGTGTEGDPYQIATAEQLAYLAQQVNNGNSYEDKYFKLTAEINLGGKEWTPIGTSLNSFTGEFSGDGHKIKNLTINSESDYIGLFGCNRGKISNVGIEGGSVKGGYNVGGVCGDNGGPISNCYNTGSVTGTGENVGGVCGVNNFGGTISNCYNTGNVTGENYVGGVCGENSVTIENCYNTGNVTGGDYVGGVCGENYYNISNCYNTGSVTGTGENVGGVCGENFDTIENCYYLEGKAEKGIGNGSGSADPKTLNELCASLPNNFDTNIWTAGSAPTEITTIAEGSRFGKKVYTLPSLIGVGSAQTISVDVYNFGTTETADWQEYTPITDAAGLQAINNNLSGNYVLMNDIDLSTVDNFTPIGTDENKAFTGKFSGNGHKIKNLTINSESNNVGLFGYSNGTIMNVGIEGGIVTGVLYVGGVCGKNQNGTIENCYNTGAVSGTDTFVGGVCGQNGGTIENCYNTGAVSGTYNVGGVCGYNFAYSSDTATATIENCYNTGKVTGENQVGGVCGYNFAYSFVNGKATATITNCYNTGNVSGSSTVGGVCGWINCGIVTNCYNTGNVSGSSDVGGVCGYSEYGKITNCYYDSTVYNNGTAVGNNNGTVSENVLGKTTKQFTSGEIAYLLSQDGSVWGQEIGKDLYPVLGGKKVYLTTGECVYYTNTFYEEEQSHSYKNGICDNCGGYDPAKQNSNGEYEISNAGQLYWFAALVNKGGDNLSAHAVLTANIIVNTGTDENAVANCGGTKQDGWIDWTPIGNHSNQFSGTFDGQGHTISGLYFNNPETDYVGLFGYINTGTIKNVGVVDSYFNGKIYVGGVCGFNIANSTATITNCYNTGAVSGTSYVGGVCGLNDGVAITNCYNTGTISGNNNVGAVCGYTVGGTIANCYYLEGCNAEGTEFDSLYGESKTAEDFNYGEVAYLLSQGCTVGSTQYKGDVWGQDLSVKNSYPVLGGKKVLANSDNTKFANDIIIYGQSATLDGMIGMNIYVAADDNYEWSASFNGNSVEKPAKDENGLYKFTFKVAAKDMAKNIDFYINENVNATVSVSGYLTELKKSESENTKLANLVTAMETYGNAANAFFNGKSVAEVTGIAENAFDDYTFTMGDPPYGISYYGSSLILESETTIRHYFKLPEGCEAESLKFGAGTEQGNPVEKQGYYYVEIKNISAEKLGNPFSVSVDGDAVISNYSALSYAKAVLESENTDANLKNLVKALYIYYQNAIAYNEPAKEDLK